MNIMNETHHYHISGLRNGVPSQVGKGANVGWCVWGQVGEGELTCGVGGVG